jgi:transmembrane sensor
MGESATVQPLAGTIFVDIGGTPAQALRLAPGEAVLVRAGRVEPRRILLSPALWPSGMLEFDATPLDQVLAQANRYARMLLKLGDPTLAAIRVTGTFRAGDAQGLSRSLAAAFGLSVETSVPGELTLRPGPGRAAASTRIENGR